MHTGKISGKMSLIPCDLPLKDRILRRRTFGLHSPTSPLRGRPLSYKLYKSENLKLATEAVSEGVTIRRAAEEYNIPRSTLHDHVSGRVLLGSKSGPQKYLSDDEENELADFLRDCSRIGYARTRQQIFTLVNQCLRMKGLSVNVTNGWWESFRRRHPTFKLRTAEKLAYVRMVSSSPEILDYYFDLLEATLIENDLIDKPCQIYNVDESGMPLDPDSLKIVAECGAKHSRTLATGSKTSITVVSCCSAAGSTIPPMVIFDRKTLNPKLTIGEVCGTMYGMSKNGWIDTELFSLWFSEHFLAYAPPIRPLLLLLDGHSSHYQPCFVKKAAEEQVIVFCLPPHTTHLTQPLDKGCFGPLKMSWRRKCQDYLVSNPGKVITRYQFSALFSAAWFEAMTMSNIVSGF